MLSERRCHGASRLQTTNAVLPDERARTAHEEWQSALNDRATMWAGFLTVAAGFRAA